MVVYAEVPQMAIAMLLLGMDAVTVSVMPMTRLELPRDHGLQEAVMVLADEEDEMNERMWAGPRSTALQLVVARGKLGVHLRWQRGDTSRQPAKMR